MWPAKRWGVEELDAEARLAKIVDAGCDQLGGEMLPELLVSLVRSGRIARRASTSRRGGSCATSSGSASSTTRTSIPTRPRAICGIAAVRRRRRAGAATVAGAARERRRPAARAAGPKSTSRPRRGSSPRATATSSSGRRTPTSRSSASTRRTSRATATSSRRSSTPATSTSRSRSVTPARARRHGADGARRAPRAAAVLPELVEACAAVLGGVRLVGRGRPRSPVRPGTAGGPAAVRAAVVDGRRPRAEARRAVRLRGAALPVRPRPLLP